MNVNVLLIIPEYIPELDRATLMDLSNRLLFLLSHNKTIKTSWTTNTTSQTQLTSIF